jgi:hypothetical protein
MVHEGTAIFSEGIMQPVVDVIEGQCFPRYEHVPCYSCGTVREPREVRRAFGLQVMFAYCPSCRLGFQTPRPSQEASDAYMNWRWKAADKYVNDLSSQLQRAARQLEAVRSVVPQPRRLADIGAGAGSFVRAARDQGLDAVGIERSHSARQRAAEFYGVELDEHLTGTYDVITLWDVIEHLRDPIGMLVFIREHLTPDGVVFMETGNFENWQRKSDGDEWGLYLFDHQFYFAPASLQQVTARAGFKHFSVLDCSHERPTLDPRMVLQQPLYSLRRWLHWADSFVRWPKQGRINVMVATARQ